MTGQLVVVDACSAMNFAAIDRMPLFETALRARGRWTQAVEGEIHRSSNSLEFRSLKALTTGHWLDEAVELDSDGDLEAVDQIRAALGGVASEPLKHLGEAESIRAIEVRAELRGAIFLTDDGDARYIAEHHGITVKDTRWLVEDAWQMGDIRCPEPYEILVAMWQAGRNVVLPNSHRDICP